MRAMNGEAASNRRRPAASLAALLAALAPACAGAGSVEVTGESAGFPAYPQLAEAHGLLAEVTFPTNHAEVFGTDLLEAGILPLAFRLGSRARPALSARLTEEAFDPHVYLPDGTALAWAPHAAGAVSRKQAADRVAALALDLTLIPPWESAAQGFVFFAFDPERVAIEDTVAWTSDEGLRRQLDLLGSLISFHVVTDEGPREVFVGLRSARWTERAGP
jgi:hypothetical protein